MEQVAKSLREQLLMDEVFGLLARQGDLSVTQISAELLIESERVQFALEFLKKEGLVEQYSERGGAIAWGLPRMRTPRLLARFFKRLVGR